MQAEVSFSLTAGSVMKQSRGKGGFVYSYQPLCGRNCFQTVENVKIHTLTDLWPKVKGGGDHLSNTCPLGLL